jgi:hypothetical protein
MVTIKHSIGESTPIERPFKAFNSLGKDYHKMDIPLFCISMSYFEHLYNRTDGINEFFRQCEFACKLNVIPTRITQN